MEGHQPPYLALGDHTVLDTGMWFSLEPGLCYHVTVPSRFDTGIYVS